MRTKNIRLLLATSNPGKLREFRALASENPASVQINLDLLPNFSQLPPFEESAPTFAENAAGKALHYSHYSDVPVLADDSGLAVDALGGAPGIHSARYAGPNASDTDRVNKLIEVLRASGSPDRRARFVCVLALALQGQTLAVISDAVEGQILDEPRGASGFGYDPVFFLPALGATFAEISDEKKNAQSHRGKAFRKLVRYIESESTRLAGSSPSL